MKILIVDDHAIVREGVAALLLQTCPEAEILQAHDGPAMARQLSDNPNITLVLLDLKLPDADGHALLEELTRGYPELPVVMLSSSEAAADVRRAFVLGARGYVSKSSASGTLRAAIDLVMAGERYIPPFVMAYADPASARPLLTKRQTEVVQCIAAEMSNRDIAQRLGLSEKTVKAHISLIFKELKVINRAQAARAAHAAAII